MNFGDVIEWNIPEGSVEEVRETETGRIIWQGLISAIYHDHIPYTLTYYPNFETTQKISTDIFYSDEPYPIQPCYYEREGHVFESWNEKSDGTGKKYLINDELSTSNDYQIYAQWVNGILMIYKDDYGETKIHNFQLSELPTPFRITDYLSPFPLVEPFNTILKGDKTRLLGFLDSNGEIKVIGENGIYNCVNIENIYLPGVTDAGSRVFEKNVNLKNLMVLNLNNINSSTFYGSAKLAYCKVDSVNLKSYPNTDKEVDVYEDQLIASKTKQGESIQILAGVPLCKSVNRNDIGVINGWVFAAVPNLTSMNVPNVSSITDSYGTFPRNLQHIHISNSILSSINDEYIVGNNGTRMIKILPKVKYIENNQITSFQENWIPNDSQLKTFKIKNDIYKSIADDTVIISKDDKTLVRVIGSSNFTQEKYKEQYSNISAIYSDCFKGCTKINDVNLSNVVSIIGNTGETIRGSSISSFIMDNLILNPGQPFTHVDSLGNCRYISFSKFTEIQDSQFANTITNINRFELSVNIPNALKIRSNAFRQNCGVRNLTFNKATSVGNQAFERCMNLQTISLNSCTSFGDNSFNDCVYIDGGIRKTHLTDIYCESVTKSYIQNNRTRIGFPSGCICHCSDGDYTIP